MSRVFSTVFALFFSLVVLFVSILNISSIKYAFAGASSQEYVTQPVQVIYPLPPINEFFTNSPFWEINAALDKLELSLADNDFEKSKLAMEHADMRLAVAVHYIDKSNYEEALLMLQKSAIYRQTSQNYLLNSGLTEGEATSHAYQLALSSLKQLELMQSFAVVAPEEARPFIIKTMDIPRGIYERMSNFLIEQNLQFPQNLSS